MISLFAVSFRERIVKTFLKINSLKYSAFKKEDNICAQIQNRIVPDLKF